jgi:CheY-like chemotaxis protein
MSTVLVVDDSAFDRELACRILNSDPELKTETAEDGMAGLARIKEGGIDLVITDLQMPEVNGLQLVTTLRLDNPDIPVILMTGQGSEVVAMDALRQGAASYVPKRVLNERLLETVHEVLTLTQADRTYQQLIDSFSSTTFNLTLDNNDELIDPLVDYVQQILNGMRFCDPMGVYQIGMALREALLNALYRGNLEITREQMHEESERLIQGKPSLVAERRSQRPYSDRAVHVDIQISREELRFVIRDEGPGFDVGVVPSPASNPNILESLVGRGLVLMCTFMDEVSFNDTGNEVTLVKR